MSVWNMFLYEIIDGGPRETFMEVASSGKWEIRAGGNRE